jgi:formate-dependent phosphoribosylglycinamide formyltransferase (GAR transformylase)
MMDVQFVLPFGAPIADRFAFAVASLPDTRFSVISQEPVERLARPIVERAAAHWQVGDCFDPAQLAGASRELAKRAGRKPDRLLGVLEQLQEPLGIARDRLGIPGMSGETAHAFRDKARMKTLLRAAGIPCAKHALAEDAAAVWRLAGETGFPLVVKPPAGAGAKATFRLDSGDQLKEALRSDPPGPGRPWLVEEFILGDEQSFETVSIGGRPVWHSLTHYLPTPLEALRQPWIQWCVVLPREVDDPRYDDIRAAAFASLDALGMETGFSHMEWFRRKDGSVAISEVAARPPGAQITRLISYAHDFDFYQAWARLMVFEEFTPPQRKYAAGAAFLRGQGTGRVVAVHGLEKAQAEMGHLVVEANLPKKGQPRSSSYEGEGNVVVRHPDTQVVVEALKKLITAVRVEVG